MAFSLPFSLYSKSSFSEIIFPAKNKLEKLFPPFFNSILLFSPQSCTLALLQFPGILCSPVSRTAFAEPGTGNTLENPIYGCRRCKALQRRISQAKGRSHSGVPLCAPACFCTSSEWPFPGCSDFLFGGFLYGSKTALDREIDQQLPV